LYTQPDFTVEILQHHWYRGTKKYRGFHGTAIVPSVYHLSL